MMFNTARRLLGNMFKRSYDGAAGGRRWRGAGHMPLQLAAVQAARGPIGTRARYLVANNALASSAADAWVSALVGSGIKPQSTHPNPTTRQTINAAWEAWTDVADADGVTDHYGQQALAARRMLVDGDVFGAMPFDGRLRVRLIDAEQVNPAINRELGNGARIVQGVEFDGAGRRVAFHAFRDRPGLPIISGLDTVRLSAEDVVQLFNPITPGQVRGLSWYAPILLRLNDLDQAHDAQLMRQKTAALFTGFIRDASGEIGGFTGAKTGDALDVSLEPGTLKVLDPGKDITFSSPAEIGTEAISFLTVTAREIAAGLGLPYEVLTGDLSGTNYSSIRAGLVEFRRRVEALQYNILVFQFCRPIWRRFITTEILSGRLQALDFERDPEAYFSARWITPRFDWVDPAKDAQAEVTAIGAGLMSPRQAVAARGYDLETLYREIADDQALAKSLGLNFTLAQPSSNNATEDANA